MAEDASGDGGDDRSAPPTEPDGTQSETDDRQPTVDDRQPTTNDRQPTVDDWTLPNREDRSDDDAAEYRIPLDLSGSADETDDESTETAETDDDQYGPEPSSAPVEPGNPTLEGAIFVFLGAIAMLLVFFRLFGLVM
ncbi:hypothetical protein RBH26_05360 [Natronolimnohabitans sp. A-GB9]|uniref:DUF7312 domain-containing protein n=1 Tax=Natronolimnohabitans sp. A-GB9 TaxID=3069757 RepID=UPI0027B19D5F|nr:hypothetical protein [Natronolimnohabitans sp. A-GB9]MDQ2049906.1 hypothetical protein [Natronolimnohabitans sp. A-GB9]